MTAAINAATVSQFLGAFALCIVAAMAILFLACALIDYTRRVEEPLGGIGDESESDPEREGGAE